MSELIRLEEIEKVYNMGENSLKVLNNVTLSIEESDFVAIMGPSGSGKSTLMNLIGCLDVPTSGKYFFKGKDISALHEDDLALFRRHQLGFIFQQFNLLSYFTAEENVALPLLYTTGQIEKEKSHPLLKRVNLFDRGGHLPREMSGGQQQRVAIARALINNPRLILADEPTGNLDSHSEKQVLEILRELNNAGMTIVMVTHEEEIGNGCHRVVRMRDGEVVSDIRNRPIPKKEHPHSSMDEFPHTGLSLAEHFRQGLKQLLSNKVRTFLSVLGVLIGVASVVTMLAIGTGAQKAIEKQLSSLGANLLVLRTGSIRGGGASLESGATALLYQEDALALESKFSDIVQTVPSVQGRAQISFRNKNWNSQVMGVTPGYEELRASIPIEGRFFTEEENRKRARLALIGMTVYRELFNGKKAIGEEIKVNKIYFKVIGILPEKGATGWRDQDDLIVVPLETGMRRLFGRATIDSVDIQIDDKTKMSELQDEILDFVNLRHKVPESQKESAFQIHNMADIQQAITESSKTMTVLLTVIATVSLLVGGIGIMNIMLVAVTERTKEIGLRKAIGARRKDILYQFLVESVVVGIVGGLLGILSGSTLALILNYIVGWPTSISIVSIVVSFIFSFLIGLLFGVYPAKNASKLHPIEALRYE